MDEPYPAGDKVTHGTFELTFYPSFADRQPPAGTAGLAPNEVYPVTAVYRPPGSLSARR